MKLRSKMMNGKAFFGNGKKLHLIKDDRGRFLKHIDYSMGQDAQRSVYLLGNDLIDAYKDRFVTTWTNWYRHFGHLVSSMVEGARHSHLKPYIEVSTGDLFTQETLIRRYGVF